MNVFFVSNSTCYYFTDELYGMLSASGREDATLALVYYGGCSVQQHYEWMRDSESNYEFRVIDKAGLHVTRDMGLAAAMSIKNWDVISFDNKARTFASGDAKIALELTEPYFGMLFSDLRERFPGARYMWHEVWANEVGYKIAFEVKTKEQRNEVYRAKRGLMEHMMKAYGIEGVPTGDAWEKVRDLEIFKTPLPEIPEAERFTLCSRLENGAFKDDFSHDGDIGGGQYLNACVWFEILTGESCVGNCFRPKYTYNGKDVSLSEEKIRILQNVAHEAVAEHRALRCK